MGRSSLVPDSTVIPRVAIRFTRLDPVGDNTDPRIGETIQCLRDMGIAVEPLRLSLADGPSLTHPPPIQKTTPNVRLLEPTPNVNLDLSSLIAIISDISHSPLPRMEEEAHVWFVPLQSYLDWKKDRVKSLGCQSQTTNPFPYDVENGEDEDAWENSGQLSRAPAAQTIQEMEKGILEEIHEHLSAVVRHVLDDEQGTSSVSSNRLQVGRGRGSGYMRYWVQRSARAYRPPPPPVCTSPGGVPSPDGVIETTLWIRNVEGRTSVDTY